MVGVKKLSKLGSVIIQEQVKVLLRMAYSYKDNILALKKKLSVYKTPENKTFKVESISSALEHMTNHPSKFSKELCEVVHDLLSSKNITAREDESFLKKEAQTISSNVLSIATQEDYKAASKDIKSSDKISEGLSLAIKKAIDNANIEEIISLDSQNSSSGKELMKVDGKSPLEYALEIGKNDLALKMMQVGFVINHRSKVDQSSVEDAIQNIIRRKSGRNNIIQDILDGKAVDGHIVKRH